MKKYRLYFMDEKCRKYFIECEEKEFFDIIAEETGKGSLFLETKEMKKRSVICSVFFLAVGIIGILVDGNIGLFAMCSVLSWATLTEDWKNAVSRIFRLEA